MLEPATKRFRRHREEIRPRQRRPRHNDYGFTMRARIARNPVETIKVGLRIGALSNVDPDALRYCFDSLKQDTPLASAAL